jgi:UDP-N-acetylmuramoyl-tripeptide--D-alanyl-D-alanine ligase
VDLTLAEIADLLDTSQKPDRSISVGGVSTDSRLLKAGMLFFALQGEHYNGHAFIEEAFQKKACGVVADQAWLADQHTEYAGPVFSVPDPLTALQEVAAYYRQKLDMPFIAVTGTNGKTTTKEMIAAVLGTKCRVVKSQGNLNNHIGVPLSICSWNSRAEAAVMEMGANHFGEIKRLCAIARPTHGVITNIGKGHLEFFCDLDGVARAKGELLEFLADSGTAFLNGDDPYLFYRMNVAKTTVTYGCSAGCDVRAEDLGCDEHGFPRMRFEDRVIRISVLGGFNLYNALAAVAVGRAFDVSMDDIHRALEGYRTIDRRMEVFTLSGIMVLNDSYNANPSSIEQSLKTLKSLAHGSRKIVVLGDMLELGDVSEKEHCQVGEWVYQMGMDIFFSIGPEMKKAAECAKQLGMKDVQHFPSKEALIDSLVNAVQGADAILVKGSRGMVMEAVVEGLRNGLKNKAGRE